MHSLSVLKSWSRWIMIQQDFKLVGTSSVVQQCSREVLALSSEFLKSPRQLLSIIIPKCNFECILSEASNFLMSLKIILLISLIKRSCSQLLDIPEGNSVDSSRCLLHVERELRAEKEACAWQSEIELPGFLQNRQARSSFYPNRFQSYLDFNWILVTHSRGYRYFCDVCIVNQKSPRKVYSTS